MAIIQGTTGDDHGAGLPALVGGAEADSLFGLTGDDVLEGNAGNATLGGGALSDLLFGNDGDDFINGGFGADRANGGAGAAPFFHLGVADHATDRIQDYVAAQRDVRVFGNSGANPGQFNKNFANVVGAGQAGVQEVFLTCRPTGQISWVLIDGAAQPAIHLSIAGQVRDLLLPRRLNGPVGWSNPERGKNGCKSGPRGAGQGDIG